MADMIIIAAAICGPDAVRGKTPSGDMVNRLIEDARVTGQRIALLCPVVIVRGHATKNREAVSDVVEF